MAMCKTKSIKKTNDHLQYKSKVLDYFILQAETNKNIWEKRENLVEYWKHSTASTVKKIAKVLFVILDYQVNL